MGPEQLGLLQKAISQGAASFLAALEALGLIALASLWVRALLGREKLQRAHAKELAALQEAHSARVDAMRLEQLERAVKLEHLIYSVVRFVQRLDTGELELSKRPAGRRKPTTNPRLSLEAEVPTLVLHAPKEKPDDDPNL